MKKTKVVIASVLKPIDDTRMLEKFGLSLAETNKYDINIIGFESKNTNVHDNIHFTPLKSFSRLSFSRLLKPWHILSLYIKQKPQVIIASTHELLIVTFLYKILFGAKFLYDVQENYSKSIRSTNIYPRPIRAILALWIRLKEWCLRPAVDHYLLAESIYVSQLAFTKSKYTVLENKYAPQADEKPAYRMPEPDKINLVYTGTIADSNGVFEAINIAKQLYQLDSSVRLRIVGYCALKRDLLRLKEEISDCDFIELNGGDHLVPHNEIIEAIQKADYGFVLKKPNNGMNDDKVLTRLFEYTANKLPIILLNNPTWIKFCEQFNAAIVVDPNNINAAELLSKMQPQNFYTKGDTNTSLWDSEKPKLVSLIDQLT